MKIPCGIRYCGIGQWELAVLWYQNFLQKTRVIPKKKPKRPALLKNASKISTTFQNPSKMLSEAFKMLSRALGP